MRTVVGHTTQHSLPLFTNHRLFNSSVTSLPVPQPACFYYVPFPLIPGGTSTLKGSAKKEREKENTVRKGLSSMS